MKLITKFITGMILSSAITAAHAWGDREQGILAGIAGYWLYNQLNRNDPQPPAPPVVQQNPPVYVYPAPPVYSYRPRCYQVPTVDQYGRVLYYRQYCQ